MKIEVTEIKEVEIQIDKPKYIMMGDKLFWRFRLNEKAPDEIEVTYLSYDSPNKFEINKRSKFLSSDMRAFKMDGEYFEEINEEVFNKTLNELLTLIK